MIAVGYTTTNTAAFLILCLLTLLAISMGVQTWKRLGHFLREHLDHVSRREQAKNWRERDKQR